MSRSNAAPTPDQLAEMERLVPAWTTVPDLAEEGGVPLSTVRTWLQEGDLVAIRRGERKVLSIPVTFVEDGAPLVPLKGTLSVLHDSGMSDAEAVLWLHTPDESLRTGSPVEDLRAGFKTEIRRRAQEMAF